ncbi:hypothetical protein MalM25_33720 [Planctomycetes bacterium MalM25]|nr:hypothetical protein MalM25_33720 [Planctomycetes bacterium MalM25]
MLPEAHRRLWRRRLRRRPLLPWLLIGTAVFDALCFVAFYNDWEYSFAIGAILAQMCLLSVWGVSSRSGLLGRLLAILVADCLLGILFVPVLSQLGVSSSIAWCVGVTAAGAVVALLGIVAERMQLDFRELPEGMSLVIHPRRPTITPSLWRGGRWNISTLLGVTSLVAVLTAAVSTADFFEVAEMLFDEEVRVIVLLTATVVTVTARAARQAAKHATVCGVAIGAVVVATFLLIFLEGSADLLFAATFFAGVGAASLAWLVGLRVRRRAVPPA